MALYTILASSALMLAMNSSATTAPSRPGAQEPIPHTPVPALEQGVFSLDEGAIVLLDGRACSWQAIPDNAVIVRMEVIKESGRSARIEFRSGKTRNVPVPIR